MAKETIEAKRVRRCLVVNEDNAFVAAAAGRYATVEHFWLDDVRLIGFNLWVRGAYPDAGSALYSRRESRRE